jgi:hypothetical protein
MLPDGHPPYNAVNTRWVSHLIHAGGKRRRSLVTGSPLMLTSHIVFSLPTTEGGARVGDISWLREHVLHEDLGKIILTCRRHIAS